LPAAPVIGDSTTPIIVAPHASKARVTRLRAAARSAGSRTTPLPLDAIALLTSNCGFTSATIGAPGAARRVTSASATDVNEMKDKSATTTSNGAPNAPASASFTCTRSTTCTRESALSRASSCP